MAMKNGRPNLEAEYERLHTIRLLTTRTTHPISYEVKHLKGRKICATSALVFFILFRFKTFANRYASADRTPSGRGTSRSAAQLPRNNS